jgi:hypothetical protein
MWIVGDASGDIYIPPPSSSAEFSEIVLPLMTNVS